MFYTIEHYPDPTAGEAMQRIKRKERNERMNAGKRFEADWRDSIAKAENVWYYRFRDSPATYYGGRARWYPLRGRQHLRLSGLCLSLPAFV